MSDPAAVLDAALELAEDERATLALRLIESLEGPRDEDAEGEWAKEVARRVRDLRAGTAQVIPAADVRKRVRGRLSKMHG